MTPRFDPRLTPARADLAAAHLEGQVTASRYVAGAPRMVVADIADLRREPRSDAALDTQILYGETVIVYDEDEGWAWVQLESDGYVGYVTAHSLVPATGTPTHRVVANRTFVYPVADMKRPPVAAVTLGALVRVDDERGEFARLGTGGYVSICHLVAHTTVTDDFVAVAERLTHTPYLWGGKSSLGIDCSGLVQLALAATGRRIDRDTDLQQATFGDVVPVDASLAGLRRGDLVFWPGHVGIMRDATVLLHANAHHMAVEPEPLRAAVDRIALRGQAIAAIRRM